jgi:hypothetical protein
MTMFAILLRYVLLALLILLRLSGLAGGAAMVADPSGAEMGLSVSMLAGLPIASFVLPGLFLMVVMGAAPLVVAFGVWRRLPWGWAAALIQGILLVLWIGLQIALWSAPMPVQWLYLTWGAAILALCLIPAARAELQKPPQAVPPRQPEIAELEAQFTKETDPERARNRQLSNTYRSGRG